MGISTKTLTDYTVNFTIEILKFNVVWMALSRCTPMSAIRMFAMNTATSDLLKPPNFTRCVLVAAIHLKEAFSTLSIAKTVETIQCLFHHGS